MQITKAEVISLFRSEVMPYIPRGDSIAKREAFNDYVDVLNRDGLVTDEQANNWSNPF